ncbi:MAG: hypothetical protein SFX72_08295 [Isosphaeraceae bacterium]|nr:hypothetical protein [Isosphaeraceae bacterium]
MRRFALIVGCVFVVGFCGCGEVVVKQTVESAQFGPHGGPIVALPAEAGFIEVVSEPVGKEGSAVIAVYFLDKALTAAMPSPPTTAKVMIETPDKPEPIELELTAEAAKGVAGETRLASKPGPFQFDQLIGNVETTVAGSPFKAAFRATR